MISFIEEHGKVFGVGPICRVLGIAPSTYYGYKAVGRDPDLASARAKQDIIDAEKIKQAFGDSRGRYGARKIWHELRRKGHDIARCTVERLMKAMGLQGSSRQNCHAIRLPVDGCARQKAHHNQSGHISALPG